MLFKFCLAGLAFVLAGALALGPARTYTEQCPAKTSQMDDVIAVLDQAPSCDRAMKLFEAFEYGASGDVQFGAIVEKKCRRFLSRLKAPQKQAYQREMGACDRKYERVRYHVPFVHGLLPGGGRPAPLPSGAERPSR